MFYGLRDGATNRLWSGCFAQCLWEMTVFAQLPAPLAGTCATNIARVNSRGQHTWPPTCSNTCAGLTQRRKAKPGFPTRFRENRQLITSSPNQQLSLIEICACNYRCNYYFNTNQSLIKILPRGCYLAAARLYRWKGDATPVLLGRRGRWEPGQGLSTTTGCQRHQCPSPRSFTCPSCLSR